MASFVSGASDVDVVVALSRLGEAAPVVAGGPLRRLHLFLGEGASERTLRLLEIAFAKAQRLAAAGGGNGASEGLAARVYAGDVVAGLAADGGLEATDTRLVVGALAEACSIPFAVAGLDLFLRAAQSPALLELPPVVAAELQLRLLVHLEVAEQVSLWLRTPSSGVECVVAVGCDPQERALRAEARAAINGRGRLQLRRPARLLSACVYRFGAADAAIVARLGKDSTVELDAYLDACAEALAPLLERELLLSRNAARERILTEQAENRLTRLAFDLHDGPVQDVLALAAETRALRDQVYPFIADSHRELAYGRFDDLVARTIDVDRHLRETAHSLESGSIASRPIAEILHREIDSFNNRSEITATLQISGDPETLGRQQRIALHRAIQESLTNIKEHSGASHVEVRLQMRRNSIETRITDNGQGFDVTRALTQAAERGRLGLIGINERMRILGGTLNITSKPGGPTVLQLTLPRWTPFGSTTGGLS
jgi:signal transduction histidine kinase